MKYLCLGYLDGKRYEAMSQSQRVAIMDECLAYDDVLWASGHMIADVALQDVRTAATLRLHNGEVSVTDGPLAEATEQLRGILVLEARDLNHAIQLISNHPFVRLGGCLEVRPAAMSRRNDRQKPARIKNE
jgi:hypothetical protein